MSNPKFSFLTRSRPVFSNEQFSSRSLQVPGMVRSVVLSTYRTHSASSRGFFAFGFLRFFRSFHVGAPSLARHDRGWKPLLQGERRSTIFSSIKLGTGLLVGILDSSCIVDHES